MEAGVWRWREKASGDDRGRHREQLHEAVAKAREKFRLPETVPVV